MPSFIELRIKWYENAQRISGNVDSEREINSASNRAAYRMHVTYTMVLSYMLQHTPSVMHHLLVSSSSLPWHQP